MCDERRFVDNHIITIDVDPETEANIRAHERAEVLDYLEQMMGDDLPPAIREYLSM